MPELLIERIHFLQDNPAYFGGVFQAGDSLEIIFDTDTRSFSVTNNGFAITTGGSIVPPAAFGQGRFLNEETQSQIRTRTFILQKYCIGTTLLRFVQGTGQSEFTGVGFPYCSFTEEPGANECAVGGPVVQDLAWSGNPSITHSTTATSADGAVTFSATSTYTPIQYVLGPPSSNWSYPTLIRHAPTSVSTFSNLSPGLYKIYAFDNKQFVISYVFEVKNLESLITPPNPATPPASVANQYYKISWNDLNGVAAIVHILKKAFTGSGTELTAAAMPMVYSQRLEGSDDKYSPIAASSIDVNLTSTSSFQFAELFTNDSDNYRVQYYKGGSLKWVGKIYPSTYQEPYHHNAGTSYPVTITAVDGLVELDNIPFLDDQGERFTGKAKQIVVIARALSRLGFDLGIRSALNIYATGMNTAASDDPLDQAYVDYDSYYQDGEPLSCLEVIKRNIEPYGASICQWDGYWWLVRKEEFVGTVTYRQFDKNGTYASNGSWNPVITKGTGITWAGMSANIDMVLARGLVQVDYHQGKSDLIRNNDFTLLKSFGSGSLDLTGIVFANNEDEYNEIGFKELDNGNIALFLTGTGLNFFRVQALNVAMFPNDKIRFGIRYQTDGQYLIKWRYQKIKFQVLYGDYYLRSDGTWSFAVPQTVQIYETDFGKIKEFEVLAPQPDAAYSTTPEDLRIDYFSSFLGDADHADYASLRTQVTVDYPEGYRSEINDGTDMLYYELENNTSAESVPAIVRPNDYNAGTNPYQWILKESIPLIAGFFGRASAVKGTLIIDSVTREFLPGGLEIPETEVINRAPKTAKNILKKEIFHGSLKDTIATTDPNNAFIGNANGHLTYRNYLRNASFAGFTTWTRDAVDELYTLQHILLNMYLAQYRKASRRVTGSLTNKATSPAYLTPISSLKDGSLYFIPTGFSLMDKECEYSGELVELVDITEGGTSTSGGTRTFNTSFNGTFA